MKKHLIVVNAIHRVLAKLTRRFGVGPRYSIFKSIPHRRVVSENAGTQEFFDLYQLGTFTAPSFCQPNSEEQTIQENVELVELQPQAEYRPHYHKNSTAVIFIISGSGTFLLGEERMDYQAGKRIVIPAGYMHGFNTHTPTLFLSIQSPPIINSVTGQIDLHYHNEEQA
jgi:quercetin dioxygenase-like cupin family protein